MTILDRALARATARKAEPPSVGAVGRLRADPYWDPPSEAKLQKEVGLYTKLSWIQIAVSKASQQAAATPYTVRQRQGGELREIEDHPFLELLKQPNPRQSRFEFLEATFSWRAVAGNCYWWLNRPSPDLPPAEIFIIPANKIRPVPDGNMGVRGYLYDWGGSEPMPLDPWEIVHFKTFNPNDSYVGLSPIEALMLDANADIGAQRFSLGFYGRDNAKAAGFLMFMDYIDEERWKLLKDDFREQHGGTKRNNIIQLRGVGEGGVKWIPAQLTQQEMGFLEQRTFTKEEIYDMFAPGLSSILSVNATEANSTAGKDTFLSMCIYPQHVAVSEKWDSDILPAYGEDLDGEFEDVRRVDTAQELREQEEYSKTHTIDEVREKYYQDKPLGDPRGAVLVSDRLAPVNAEVEKLKQQIQSMELRQAPKPEEEEEKGPDESAILTAGKRLDLRRWQTKAIKAFAGGRALDVPFDPDYLSDEEAITIRAALKRAQGVDELLAVFRGGEG